MIWFELKIFFNTFKANTLCPKSPSVKPRTPGLLGHTTIAFTEISHFQNVKCLTNGRNIHRLPLTCFAEYIFAVLDDRSIHDSAS